MNKLMTAVLGLSLMAGSAAFAAAPQADSTKTPAAKTATSKKTTKTSKKSSKTSAKKPAATTPAASPSK
jgi:hypothetical protein